VPPTALRRKAEDLTIANGRLGSGDIHEGCSDHNLRGMVGTTELPLFQEINGLARGEGE
jgi:hypothetical protein